MKLNFISFDLILSRIFRYILKRYIGQYIIDFSSDALSYGVSHGKGSIENVKLNVEALNELSEEYNLPLEFLSGSIDFVSIFVPWTSLLSENTVIEVKGLKLVFQPKERPQDVSMFDSMWGSMASSLQIAEDYVNEDDVEIDVPDRSEGLKKIAKTIDAVLSNLKIVFHDTSLKVEHIIPQKSTGISLEIKIKMAEYFDEAGVNAQTSAPENEKPSYESSTFSVKRVVFEGVSLYTAEFLSEERSFTGFHQAFSSETVDTPLFMPGSPEMPPTHPSLPVKKSEPNCNSEPILISRLNGQQELRLKLKQSERIEGPKVDVEFNFGAFNLFLTPQQVHLLFTLINSITKPTDSNCDISKKVQPSVANKPMRPADYALVEQELLRQQEKSDVTTKSLKNQGWSSHSLDESDEDFHLMTMENKVYPEVTPCSSLQDDPLTSSTNSDIKSECNSSYSSTPRGKHRGSSVQAILTDPLSELTHFRGCFSSLLVIILHDDSVQETFTGEVGHTTISLEVQAETFFNDLLSLQMDGFNFKDFSSAREPLSKLCQTNHLRLMASGIVLDGNETSSSVERILKFNISFHQFEVLECLYNSSTFSSENQNPNYMQLITFPKKSDPSSDLKEACFRLKYSQVECTSQNRTNKPPSNKLDIQFDKMECDVDISLTDRIRTLLNFNNTPDHAGNKWDHWKVSDIGIVTQTSSKTDITLSSTSVTVNLRFPIPDLRSVHDMERAPWWQQNIHKETLILRFQEITLKTTLDDDQLFEKYEIQCQDVHGFFQMQSSEEPISFLRVSVDPDVDEISRKSGFDWPRLVIQRMTKVASPDFESGLQETDELISCSLSYALMTNLVSEPSPFCSTSVIHDNKAEKERNSNLSTEHEEIIKPSDKENMQVFVEQTVNKSECVFEFTLPTVNIIFPDQNFFELLYNRLGNDLILWENTSLNSSSVYEHGNFKVHIPGLDANFPKGPNQDQVFRPFINDSNSDSEEEETMYMSVHEYYQRQKEKHQKPNNASLTKYCLTFNIAKGSILINTPLTDESLDAAPTHCGKLQLRVEDASLFLAISYKGDPNESYMCLISDKSALYHDGMAEIENKHSIVQPLNFFMEDTLKCIIYASDPGMHMKSVVNLENPNKEMLKFSIHVVKSPKQQIKTFKIAIEIAGATLRHYVVPAPQMWISQLIQFLKVNNFPVKGYIPPAVVTELHLNLSNCGIDYRPFKLPYRTALTVENFNMSCNVTATTPSFNFRIISEELRLHLSNNIEAKKIDLRKNYVCVIESGLIDISIRTSVDEKDNPKLEMFISNNKVHIRTCVDSFKALLDLINYLSTNGDMEPNCNNKEENENYKSSMKAKSIDSDSENLDVLMAEAMKECSRVLNGDEKMVRSNSEYEYSNTDDEFCILEDDPGVGLIPKNGGPQVRILTDEPIKIIENHFSIPPGKSDVLKAPKHYPNPLFLLKFKELSLVWYLYGGNDFKKKTKSKRNGTDAKIDNRGKHGVTFSDQGLDNIAVSFCKVTPKNFDSGVVQFSMEHVTINENQGSFSPDSWLHKGGSERNHDVLMELHMTKVQFQQEVYPLDSEYSSRYILLINDIEIRDRLSISQINKFLYHYTTKDLPRQSHANMIEIKAVYTRPDPKSSTEECSLRVSCKPLRLNVDQDALMFLVTFFQEAVGVPDDENSEGELEMHAENVPPSSNLISNANIFQSQNKSNETFYRYFSFSPDVLIRIDYHGKRVQMEQGAVKGLILGLGQLNASEIRLKRLCYRHGLLGHKKLVTYALTEWQQDILKNQLPSLLGGVGPMYSFVQLFQGVKDLFYLPVVHYRRDGQIVRGLQKGASSFSTSTVVAALDLASRFFYALQGTAELGFDMVSPGPRARDKYVRSQELYRKNSQPADFIEGVSAAINVMKEGFEDTARTIYRVAATEHEHKGVPGAVGGVLRQIPPSLFRPIILSSEATSYVLDGARHQLMPDAHQEDIHKWKTKNN